MKTITQKVRMENKDSIELVMPNGQSITVVCSSSSAEIYLADKETGKSCADEAAYKVKKDLSLEEIHLD